MARSRKKATGCKAVSWAEVARLAKLPSLAAVDIGLRTGIRGLKKERANSDYAGAIEALIETDGILHRQRDCFLNCFMTRSFVPFKRSVTSGFGLETSSALSESCIGSMT